MTRKGFKVFATCLTENGREELEKDADSDTLKALIMDVRDMESIQRGYQFVQSYLTGDEGNYYSANNQWGIFIIRD